MCLICKGRISEVNNVLNCKCRKDKRPALLTALKLEEGKTHECLSITALTNRQNAWISEVVLPSLLILDVVFLLILVQLFK